MPKQPDLFPEVPLWDEGLTGRQRRFVELYCTDKACFLNPRAAYIKTYRREGSLVPPDQADANAARMMRHPKIKDAIARLLRSAREEKDIIAGEQVLSLLEMLASYNPADIIDKDGNLKVDDIEKLGPLALCITGIRKTRGYKEIRLFDRFKAIDALAEYLKLVRPQGAQAAAVPIVILPPKEAPDDRAAAESGEPREQGGNTGIAIFEGGSYE
jgi:hypothetical protein